MADFTYDSSYIYNGIKYTRGDAVVVNGDYYIDANATSRYGSTGGNVTKYFYGRVRYNDGSTFRHSLALANGSDHTHPSFAYMDFSSIRSGGTPVQCTVTFNKNGGSGGTNSVIIAYGTAQGSYPSIELPSRAGYIFRGYYDASSGGTQYYNANGASVRTWNKTSNTTLYAQWTADSYTITYNGNEGQWDGKTTWTDYAVTDQFYKVIDNSGFFIRNGYTFNGWSTSPTTPWVGGWSYQSDGNDRYYSSHDKLYHWQGTYLASYGNPTLYANWIANEYNLTINPNGGKWNGSSAQQSFAQKYKTTKSIANPTLEGNTFAGWTLSGSGSMENGVYTYGAGNGELMANWSLNSHTVTFDSESAGGSQNKTKSVMYGNTVGALPIPTKPHHKFVGWFDSQGNQISENQIITANVTFYAGFELDSHASIITDQGIKKAIAWVSVNGKWEKTKIWKTKGEGWKC